MEPERPTSPEWQRLLERGDSFRHLRALFRLLPSSPRCELCLAPFSGPGAAVLRAVKGIRRSTLNPRYCNDCELLSEEHPGGAEVDVAMLFADVRGSTTLAERMTPGDFSSLIERFYRVAGDVLIDSGALIEKLVGDEVSAIYTPGFAGQGYVRAAIESGQRLRRALADDQVGQTVPVGVGVHCGRAYVGAVGERGRLVTITALGDTVNVAARLASIAGPGELLVSQEACSAADYECDHYPLRTVDLKGRATPVEVRVLAA